MKLNSKRSLIAMVIVGLLLFMIPRPSSLPNRVDVQHNLKALYMAFRMEMNSHPEPYLRGYFPPLSPVGGRLNPSVEAIYPQLLSDASLFISANHPDYETLIATAATNPKAAINDDSYWYLGYHIPNEEIGLAFIEAYRERIEFGGDFESHLPLPSPIVWKWLGNKIKDNSIGRLHIQDIAPPDREYLYLSGADGSPMTSKAPLMIERPELNGSRSTVLFGDGHTEVIPYPGRFPMTEAFIEGLRSLDALESTPQE